jgi:hypothetical protein
LDEQGAHASAGQIEKISLKRLAAARAAYFGLQSLVASHSKPVSLLWGGIRV